MLLTMKLVAHLLGLGMASSSVHYRLTPIHTTASWSNITTKTQVTCMNLCSEQDKCCGFRFSLNSETPDNCILLQECHLNETKFHLGMPSYLKSYKDDITSTIFTKTSKVDTSTSAHQITTAYDSTTKATTPVPASLTTTIDSTTTAYMDDLYDHSQCGHVPEKNRMPHPTSHFERINPTQIQFNNMFPKASSDYTFFNTTVTDNVVYEEIGGLYYVAKWRNSTDCSLLFICKSKSQVLYIDDHKDDGYYGIYITWDSNYGNWTMKKDNRQNRKDDVMSFEEFSCRDA